MKRGVEQRPVLQHLETDVREFPPGKADDDHFGCLVDEYLADTSLTTDEPFEQTQQLSRSRAG